MNYDPRGHVNSVAALRSRLNWRWHCEHIKHYAWLFIVLLDFCVLDAWTTMVFMHELGIETEAHDWIRTVSYWFGPTFGPIVGKGCQFAAFYLASVLAQRFSIIIGLILCISYLLGAVINTMVMMGHA